MDSEERSGYAEQPESKGFRVVKNIFKGLLFGASAVVWILVFWLIISTREPSFYKKMIFTDRTREAAAAAENYQVWQVHVRTWMNYDNSISVSNVWYSEDTQELEIGFRFNTKLLRTKDENGNSVENTVLYSLTDGDGRAYEPVNVEETVIGRYHYYRVCYSNVSLPLSADRSSGPVLTLSWTRSSDGEPLAYYFDKNGIKINDAELVIYNADTVVQQVEFET